MSTLYPNQYSKMGANYLDAGKWSEVQLFRVAMLEERPILNRPLDPPVKGELVYGWYNDRSDMVELYWSSTDGQKLTRISARMEAS